MKILEITYWFLFGLGIAMVVWLIVGNTPSLDQALLILLVGMVIRNTVDINSTRKDISFLKRQFGSLARDFRDFKNIIAKR